MATFTLLFTGLILHYASGVHAKTAALVDAPHHTPKLVVVAGVCSEKPTGWEGKKTKAGCEYDLKGRKVTIESINEENMKVDYLFYKRVPSLKSIFEPDDDLVLRVDRKEIKEGVTAAFVDYSGGMLSVADCFCEEVHYIPSQSGDPRCLARTVRFDGTTTGSEIKIKDGLGGYIVVPDKATIYIQNITDDDEGHHQMEYRRLMTKKKEPRRIVETNRTCRNCSSMANRSTGQAQPDMFLEPPVVSVSIECSNSQWP